MNPVQRLLARQRAVVLDGALATELERRGADLRDPLWSAKLLVERPELIREVHADYFAAGADVAITATYQASFEGFARRGIGFDAGAVLMRKAVLLAAQARDAWWAARAPDDPRTRPLVAASVGPYGAFLADGSEYRGDYARSEAELMEWHWPRLEVLAGAGADLLACETIPNLDEARALALLMPEFPAARFWMSFSARDGEHISSGERIEECARALALHPQLVAIGVNCTAPQHVPSLVRRLRDATDVPIVVYPNSGEVYSAATGTWGGAASCASFAEGARAWFDAGARLIGGCCRSTPEDIREVAAWVRGLPAGGVG